MAWALAQEFQQHFDLNVNQDEIIAGGLLHDVGKSFEFDPERRKQWKAHPRTTGFPSMRHSVYGAYVALAVGLPERIAHIPGAHSREGQFILRSLACEIISVADHAYWGITGRAGLLEK
jgi:putative nucleotidyltransferase with HDIG domain